MTEAMRWNRACARAWAARAGAAVREAALRAGLLAAYLAGVGLTRLAFVFMDDARLGGGGEGGRWRDAEGYEPDMADALRQS